MVTTSSPLAPKRIPLLRSLPKIIGSPCFKISCLSAAVVLSAISLCAPSLKITQFCKISITEVPSCLAASNITSTISLGLLSNALAKKDPCAANTNLPTAKGFSMVP